MTAINRFDAFIEDDDSSICSDSDIPSPPPFPPVLKRQVALRSYHCESWADIMDDDVSQSTVYGVVQPEQPIVKNVWNVVKSNRSADDSGDWDVVDTQSLRHAKREKKLAKNTAMDIAFSEIQLDPKDIIKSVEINTSENRDVRSRFDQLYKLVTGQHFTDLLTVDEYEFSRMELYQNPNFTHRVIRHFKSALRGANKYCSVRILPSHQAKTPVVSVRPPQYTDGARVFRRC